MLTENLCYYLLFINYLSLIYVLTGVSYGDSLTMLSLQSNLIYIIKSSNQGGVQTRRTDGKTDRQDTGHGIGHDTEHDIRYDIRHDF